MNASTFEDFTPESLFVGLNGKEQAAWARVARLYAPLIYHWCKALGVSSAQDCDDICQDVLVKVMLYGERFRARYPKGSLRGWLHRVTRHVVIDYFSHGKRMIPTDPGIMDLTLQPQFDDEPIDNNTPTKQLYRRAMSELEKDSKPRSWSVFRALIETNNSYEQVAEQHNMSVGNVRIIKFRMLARLREIVELNDNFGYSEATQTSSHPFRLESE